MTLTKIGILNGKKNAVIPSQANDLLYTPMEYFGYRLVQFGYLER